MMSTDVPDSASLRTRASTWAVWATPRAAEEHVVDDVEVLAECEVLVDDLDAERGGVLRGVDGDRVPLEPDLPLVVRLGPGQALDQGRLPGAVVADEGGHLA